MKKIAVLLLGLIATLAAAEDNRAKEVTFSKYSPQLTLASYNQQTHTHRFVGTITLTGTLFLVFDMKAPDRANGEINFQKFVPDPAFISKLPAVVGGFYPGPVKYISLNAPLEQLVPLFGGKAEFTRVSHGTSHEASKRATIVLSSYSATVECDSRGYLGEVVSVAPVQEPQQVALGEAPHGC